MLKDYLNYKQISVYKLSEMADVPYSTMNELVNGKKNIDDCKIKTIARIAKALNLSIEALLSIINEQKMTLSHSWEDERYKKCYFPVIVNNPNYECKRIHPLMQKKVNDVYQAISKLTIIEKVILFGSSVNLRCTIDSDLDLAIRLKDDCFNKANMNLVAELIGNITNYNVDIVWLNTVDEDSQLFKNIQTTGVMIYE